MANTADTTGRGHPIAAGVSGIADELKTLRDAPAWSMGAAETRDTLVEITRLTAQIAELEARVAAHGQTVELEADSGATSTANWWAHATKQTRAGAHRKTRLAKALDTARHEPVRIALAEGRLLVDQAEVIVAAVDALPEDLVDDEVRAQAQATLIAEAARFDAKALRTLGRRILDVIAPEVGEAHEARLLQQEEREAEAAAVFRMSDDGHGKSHGSFTIPTAYSEMLRKALLAIAAPKHRTRVDGQAPVPGRPSAHKMGEAFCEYVTGYPAEHLPDAGGVSATVVVTMTLDTLLGGLKAAQLDTATRISPSLARRWACEAGIIPAILGSESQVLDLGRKNRLFNKAQRIALGITQGGCTAEGCDWPPGMTHAHHDQPWSRGGTTDLENGRHAGGHPRNGDGRARPGHRTHAGGGSVTPKPATAGSPSAAVDTAGWVQSSWRRSISTQDAPRIGRRSAGDGATRGGHQPLGVGGDRGRLCRRLHQAQLDCVVGAGDCDDVRHRGDRLRWEVDRAAEARRQVPGVGGGVNDREVDDHSARQDAEGCVVPGGHHAVGAPQPQRLGSDLDSDGREVTVVRDCTHRLLQRHELLAGDAAGPEQLVLQDMTGQSADRPRRTVGDDVHLCLVEQVDHLDQLAFGVLQEHQVIHRATSLSDGDSTTHRAPGAGARLTR